MSKLDDDTPHDMDTCPLCKLIAAHARGRRARELKAASTKAPGPAGIENPVAWRASDPETGDSLFLCDRCTQGMRPVRSLPDEPWGIEVSGQVLTLTPVRPENGVEYGVCDLCRGTEGNTA